MKGPSNNLHGRYLFRLLGGRPAALFAAILCCGLVLSVENAVAVECVDTAAFKKANEAHKRSIKEFDRVAREAAPKLGSEKWSKLYKQFGAEHRKLCREFDGRSWGCGTVIQWERTFTEMHNRWINRLKQIMERQDHTPPSIATRSSKGDPCAQQDPCYRRQTAMMKEFARNKGLPEDYFQKSWQRHSETPPGLRVKKALDKHQECRRAKAGGAKIHCCRTGLEICHAWIALVNWLKQHPESLRAKHEPDTRRAARPKPTVTPSETPAFDTGAVAKPHPTVRRLTKRLARRRAKPSTTTQKPKKEKRIITDPERLKEMGCPPWTAKGECVGQDFRCYEAKDDVTSEGLEGRLKVIPFSSACRSLVDEYWQRYGDNPPPLVKAPSGDKDEPVKKADTGPAVKDGRDAEADGKKPQEVVRTPPPRRPERTRPPGADRSPGDISRLITQVIKTIRSIRGGPDGGGWRRPEDQGPERDQRQPAVGGSDRPVTSSQDGTSDTGTDQGGGAEDDQRQPSDYVDDDVTGEEVGWLGDVLDDQDECFVF